MRDIPQTSKIEEVEATSDQTECLLRENRKWKRGKERIPSKSGGRVPYLFRRVRSDSRGMLIGGSASGRRTPVNLLSI